MAARKVTISTHMGVTVAQAHNRREPEIVSREPHIDPNGVNEVWLDRSLLEVYEEQFGKAITEYDATARPAQRIGSAAEYLQRITERRTEAEAYNAEVKQANAEIAARNATLPKDQWEPMRRTKAAAAPVYEEVVGVYLQEGEEIPERDRRELLREYYDGWQRRNPNMALVGAYYHADEPGAEPHLHIDYVPVGSGYLRGAAKQNSLEKALQGQGIRSQGYSQTAQIQWEAGENMALQELCEVRGFEVLHPQRGKHSKHVSTSEMKLQREMERKEAAVRRREAAAAAKLEEAEKVAALAKDALTKAQEAEKEASDRYANMFDFLDARYGGKVCLAFIEEFGGSEFEKQTAAAKAMAEAEAAVEAAKNAPTPEEDSEPVRKGPAKPNFADFNGDFGAWMKANQEWEEHQGPELG